jgi:hypothetical protein
MSTTTRRESARIYDFPMRLPRRAESRGDQTTPDVASRRLADLACGAWYHEAAAEEEKRNARR